MLFYYLFRLFQDCTGEKYVSQFGSIRNGYMKMMTCLKYLNYGFFLPQRYRDAAFGTFLGVRIEHLLLSDMGMVMKLF